MSRSDKLRTKGFATRAIHAGTVPEDGTRSVTTPIYPSSTYRVEFPGDESGYVYSRWGNPTRQALEEGLALVENARYAYAYASGLSALTAVLHTLKSGDHIIAAQDLYGGTRRLFERVMRNFQLDFSYVSGTPDSFAAAIKPNTRLIWFETPTNPLLQLIDIAAVVKIARRSEHGPILVGVDNTFASPWLQRPLDLGADIVHHSASKYLGGHCDVIAGALMCNDDALAEKLRFNQFAVGGMLGPFEAWLVQRGLKTLAVRMERHCQNARAVAEFLKTAPMVKSVMYPGLDGKPLPNGMTYGGGMVSFYLDADFERVKAFCTATEVFVLAESLGGVESLINHPAAMTHASIPKDVRMANGITDGLVRLSVGLEDKTDLIGDLQSAFDRVGVKVRG